MTRYKLAVDILGMLMTHCNIAWQLYFSSHGALHHWGKKCFFHEDKAVCYSFCCENTIIVVAYQLGTHDVKLTKNSSSAASKDNSIGFVVTLQFRKACWVAWREAMKLKARNTHNKKWEICLFRNSNSIIYQTHVSINILPIKCHTSLQKNPLLSLIKAGALNSRLTAKFQAP